MDQNEFYEPTQNDKDLTSFVVDHCDRWRDYRNTNFLDKYLEYERIFRGEWAAEDKTRDSERSRIVTPSTQQAVETRHAEIMEAIFGQGEFFDIEDDLKDVNGNPLDVEVLKAQLMEDFKQDKIRKSIDAIELMAEIYGTGIGEIVVKTEKIFEPSTQAIPGQTGQAAIGVVEKNRIAVKIMPVNPKNFLFDPNGTSIDCCLSRITNSYTRQSKGAGHPAFHVDGSHVSPKQLVVTRIVFLLQRGVKSNACRHWNVITSFAVKCISRCHTKYQSGICKWLQEIAHTTNPTEERGRLLVIRLNS